LIKPEVDTAKAEYSFSISTSTTQAVTSTSGRSNAVCLITGDAIPIEYIQEQGKKKKLGRVLIGIVAERKGASFTLRRKDRMMKLRRASSVIMT
jgi:hypothetical protein